MNFEVEQMGYVYKIRSTYRSVVRVNLIMDFKPKWAGDCQIE